MANDSQREIRHLIEQGNYQAALVLAEQTSQATRAGSGEQSIAFADILALLGLCYQASGDYSQAQDKIRWAWNIRRKIFGNAAPQVAEISGQWGELLRLMGKTSLAERRLKEAVEMEATAPNINRLARLYRTLGRYAEAEPLHRKAQQMRVETEGKQSADYAESLNDLAELERARGNYPAAQTLYEQALQIRQTVWGEGHLLVAETLDNLGQLFHATGDFAAAADHFQQALTVAKESGGETHPVYLEIVNNRANLHQTRGDYEQAEQLFEQVRTIRRQTLGESHPDFLQSVTNLGTLYQAQGRYGDAKGLHLLAWRTRQKTLGNDHPAVAHSLADLALTFQALGQYDQAEPRYETALQIRRTILGDTHPDTATSLHHLAQFYQTTGRYDQARSRYEDALATKRAVFADSHPSLADSLHDLATLFELMGDYEQAVDYFSQALAIKRARLLLTHPTIALTLHHLAGVLTTLEQYNEAETHYQDALKIRQQSLGENHPDTARTMNNLSQLYQHKNEYVKAESLAQKAVGIIEQRLGRSHPDFAHTATTLAAVYHAQGNYGQAKDLYRWAMNIERKSLGPQHPDVGQLLTQLAAIDVAQEREQSALKKMGNAAEIDSQTLGQVFSIGSERQRMAYIRRITEDYARYLSLVSQHLSDEANAVAAAFDLVLQRKALGAEALAVQRDAIWANQEPDLKEQLDSLKQLRLQIAQKTLAGPGDEDAAAYQQQLAAWSRDKEALEVDLAERIPEMNLTRQLQAADRQAVAVALPPDSVLIEFVRFEPFDFTARPAEGETQWQAPRYLAFTLPAGAPDEAHTVDLGEAATIEKLIAEFRTSITGEEEKRGAQTRLGRRIRKTGVIKKDSGSKLRQIIFEALVPSLQNRTQLLIAPDGDLARLPFEILPNAAGERLIDHYHLSYLSVGRDVLRLAAPPPAAQNPPLIIADPDFDLTADGTTAATRPDVAMYFKRLDGTRKEGEALGQMLAVQPHFAGQALEATIKAQPSPRIFHIATHGFFLIPEDQSPRDKLSRLAEQRDNPLMRAGLALAGINVWNGGDPLPPDAEDGVLTGEDVSGLDLTGTELVVLSACETGLGEVEVGEGVFGLRRAFALAGASTLVMSLWQVPDAQTQMMMEAFYENILAGMPRAEALREAQLALKAKYDNPFFWGAFICQGEPRAMQSRLTTSTVAS